MHVDYKILTLQISTLNDFEWKRKNNPAPLNQQARNTVKSLAKLVTQRLESQQVC